MKTTLAEIKQALADYAAAKIAYETAAKHVAAQGRASREDRIAEDTYDGERASMGRNAPDYLRALLTVVDAAAEIEALQDEINLDMSDKALPVWKKLMDSVKALK